MFALVIKSAVVPALACAAVLIAGTRPWQRPRASHRAWLALALAVGYTAGHVGIAGAPTWVPIGAAGWLVHVAVVAAVAAVLQIVGDQRPWTVWAVRATAATAGAYLILRVPVHTQWSTGHAIAAVGVVTASTLVVSRAFESAAARASTLTMLAALGVATGGSAGILVLSGTALVATLVGALAAAIGAAFLIEWAAPGSVDTAAAAPVLAGLLVATWTIALLFADMPTPAAPLLIAAPAALWLAARFTRDRLRPRFAAAACLLALLLPLAGAAGVSAAHYFAPADAAASDDSDYGYGYE